MKRAGTAYDIEVVRKLAPSPGEGGRDLLTALASDPTVRRAAEAALRDPEVRSQINRAVRQNPDLANRAMDFLKRGRF